MLGKVDSRSVMAHRESGVTALVGRSVLVTVFIPSDLGPVGPVSSTGRIRRILRIVTKWRTYSKALVELDEPLPWGATGTRLISAVSQSYRDKLDRLVERRRLPVIFAAEAAWMFECAEDDPRLLSEPEGNYVGFGGIHLTS